MKRKEVVLFQRLGLTFSRRVSNYRAAYLQEKLNKAITQKQKKIQGENVKTNTKSN